MSKNESKVKHGKAPFIKDKRRRHHHFMVTIHYADGEKFGRVYTDKEKADRFAERQRRSPVVKSVRVSQVSSKIFGTKRSRRLVASAAGVL